MERLARSVALLGMRLFGAVLESGEGSRNVAVSSLSLTQALSLLALGAEGDTLHEILAVLGGPSSNLSVDDLKKQAEGFFESVETSQTKEVDFDVANSLWSRDLVVRKRFSSECVDFLRADVGTGFDEADINKWCAEKTRGKIDRIVSHLDPLVKVVLVNALYFRGDWAHKFPEALTKTKPFRRPGGPVQVRMMRLSERLPYHEGKNFVAVSLPYAGGAHSALVVLPGAGAEHKAVLDEVQDGWHERLSHRAMRKTDVVVEMPRFTIDEKYALEEAILPAMGMRRAFGDHAQFELIAADEDLRVDKVTHVVVLEVNEKGTELAAATGLTITNTMLPPPPKLFICDRPFFFMLRIDELSIPLVHALVHDPPQADA